MAYAITLSNGTPLTSISNNSVDTTTSLSLVGRNLAGYGLSIAEDFVHLLENFANITNNPPSHPLTGQLWFNSTTSHLLVWYSSAWHDIGASGITIEETTADNIGLTLYDPLAPSGSRYYRIRIRDDGLFAGHWVLESLQDDGLTVNTVILNTNNVGAIKLATTPSTGDNSTLIATTAFVKNQGYAPLLSPVFIGAPAINGSGSGAVLELQGDGSNPNKFIRASLGHFQVVNSANTLVLLDVSDAGVVVAPIGTIQATGQVIIDGTAGVPGAVLKLAGNGVTTPTKWVRAVNGHFQIVNSANTVVILDLDDTGVLGTTGNIAAGGRLRASLGAFGSGDGNAATLLNDFINGITETGGAASAWWRRSPDGYIEQGGFVAVFPGTLNAQIGFYIPFASVCTSILATVGSDIAPETTTGAIGIAPYGLISSIPFDNLHYFAISNTNAGFVSQGIFWVATGF